MNSNLEAETVALREVLVLAESKGFKNVIVETDAEVMYKEIRGEKKSRNRRIKNFVKDIMDRKPKFDGFRFNWIFLWIVKQAKKDVHIKLDCFTPSSFIHILSRGRLPAPHDRFVS